MKKVILLLALFLLVMLSTIAVDSYSSAEVNNETMLNIAGSNCPITLTTEEDLKIRQGESKAAITITSNMHVPLNYAVEIDHFALELLPAAGTIIPDSFPVIIEVAVDTYCDPQILFNIPVILIADFAGGNARITAAIDLEVLEGELELYVIEDSLVAFWNDNEAPADAEYFYRYREPETHNWPDHWTPINPDDSIEQITSAHGPGEYDFKVQLGNTRAQLPSPIIILPDEEADETEQEELNNEYFKHEVKGLPDACTKKTDPDKTY